jgi:hypothetical protein
LERPDWRFDLADDLGNDGNQIAPAGKLSELVEGSHRHCRGVCAKRLLCLVLSTVPTKNLALVRARAII